MTVARTVEISSESPTSFEDAVKVGIERANATLRHVQRAWVKDHIVVCDEGKITGYRVHMAVTFVLDT